MRLPVSPQQLKKRLTEEGLVTPEQFDALLAEAEHKNQDFLDILVSGKIVDQAYLYRILSEILGVELAALGAFKINEETIRLLPEEIARQRQVIIFGREPDGTLDAAMLDPSDLETIEFLKTSLGAKIRPFLATLDDLNRGFSIYGVRSTAEFKRIIEENIQASLRSQTKSAEEAAADLPIVAIVDNILSYALAMRASDIHLEVLEDMTLIRYRIDGILYEIIHIPRSVHSALVARVKILSGLKLDEHFKPQDGRFRYQIGNRMADVRVAVMPTYHGEKVEMRLLEAAQKPLSLEELGMLAETKKLVEENLKKAYGMLLVCGPTGSGKTTTLYAMMNILNQPNVNIVTVEDPVEYNMRYVNQTQINPQAGITFASGLRAILRQDPDIIMVGEIRDKETAGISVQAALTGHLLLSSLHTNDAPTAIPRLFDLGVPPFLAASVLNMVLAQRLVRRICPFCIYSYEVDESVLKTIKEQYADLGVPPQEQRLPKILFRGKGCNVCGGTGYRGRMGIFEMLEATDTIKKLMVAPKFDLGEVRRVSRQAGSRTMFEDGLDKAQRGLTTIEEVLRVVRE